VETGHVLDAIALTGVDLVQGYYVGMPELLYVYLGDRFAESGH
jgi:EAL domain-containing protein (putative c-di-GMP-specific phosphodiesterase class I)